MKNRIEWVDVTKIIGMFLIYLGHYQFYAGRAYAFVFKFHVPLFFFLSGCMNNYDREKNIFRYIKKRLRKIMLPFFLFAVLSAGLNLIIYDSGYEEALHYMLQIAEGLIRNHFFAPGLWFLSCLFVMEIIFMLIRYLKKKWLILAAAVGIFIISETLIGPRPVVEPHLPYNIDSALYYLLYYALGYVLYPYLAAFFELDSKIKKNVFVIVYIILFAAAVLLFYQSNLTYSLLLWTKLADYIVPVIEAALMILFTIFTAKLLENIKILSKMGRESLFLCGNEWIIKTVIPLIFTIFGLNVTFANPLAAYLFTAFILWLNYKLLIPFEKGVVRKVTESFRQDR